MNNIGALNRLGIDPEEWQDANSEQRVVLLNSATERLRPHLTRSRLYQLRKRVQNVCTICGEQLDSESLIYCPIHFLRYSLRTRAIRLAERYVLTGRVEP